MALERTSEMTSLLRSEMGKFRKKMEGAVSPEVLAGNDAKQAMQEFSDCGWSRQDRFYDRLAGVSRTGVLCQKGIGKCI